MAERRGRITAEQATQALTLLDALSLEKDEETAEQIPTRTFSLVRKHRLTLCPFKTLGWEQLLKDVAACRQPRRSKPRP